MRPSRPARLLRVLLVAAVLGAAGAAAGHALQPGYLEIRRLDGDLHSAVWKVPAVGGRPMAIVAELPERCRPREPDALAWNGAAYLAAWTASCPGGLEGENLRIVGLEDTSTDVLVRLDLGDGGERTHRLTASEPSFRVPARPSSMEVVRTYLLLGCEHILLGIDHLLFVLALLILVSGVRRLVATITAFTVAHSLTLAGATLGLVHAPGPPIEAVIALSIAFVAAEILRSRRGEPGWTERRPWIVAFAFGLLHGFGFAGALIEIGLPPASVPVALLFFNVGVEAGQLLFIGVALGTLALARRTGAAAPPWGWVVPPYAIGSLAAFWVLQRISLF